MSICPRGLFLFPSDIEQRIEDHARLYRSLLDSKGRYPKRWIHHAPPVHESPIIAVGPRSMILGPDGKPIETGLRNGPAGV